jgi:erythronate-4-phosphate dehydrogenase
MVKIVADNKIPFLKGVLEKYAGVVYFPGREIKRKQIMDADALIVRTRTKCDRQLLMGTRIKYIATATIGFDHIDIDYCLENGIEWSNAPGCNSSSVMQYIASALGVITGRDGMGFKDLTLGIVGVGHVGKKIDKLAKALGMNVLLNDPPRERSEGVGIFTSLDELLAGSDIVTMHVPLNREGPDRSFHMAGEDFFGRMRKGAWFINSSRGEVVETVALKRALRSGHLAGSVIDVWENEPEIDRELLALADIATPHIAGYSLDGKANGTAGSVGAVSRFFGLGVGDWYPEIPSPANPLIRVEKDRDNEDQVISQLFLHTYDIMADSKKLKAGPEYFEKQRDDYPPRREFGAYKVSFENPVGSAWR